MKKVSIFGKLIKKLNEFLKKIKSFKVKEKKKSQKREDVFGEEPKVSNPYVLTVKNTKDIPQKAVLFGYAKFANEKNFGSDEGIEITGRNDISYGEYLITSSFYPFSFNIYRITCQNPDFLSSKIFTFDRNIDGHECKREVSLCVHLNTFQCQSDMVDILEYEMTVTCNNYMSFMVPPETEFTIVIFPKKIYNNH